MTVFTVASGMLVFVPPNPPAVRAAIPHAKEIDYQGQRHMVVPHGLSEVQVLRNLGMPAPSPINFGWPYPGRVVPFMHQKVTSDFLTVHPRALVLSTMGTGKTKNALWAAEYLMKLGLVHRVMVICPRSCMHTVWAREIFQTVMHRTCAVLVGDREKRRAMVGTKTDYLIINHDGFGIVADLVRSDPTIDLYIVDEASAYINPATQRYKFLKSAVCPVKQAWPRLWLLTGTPVPNSPADAWALAKLVKPENVPQYFMEFKRRTMTQINTFKWYPKPEGTQLAFAAMQPAIRFTKDECLDLPPVTYSDREVPLSPIQVAAMKSMAATFVHTTKAGEIIEAANAAIRLSKLLQIACGCVYDEDGEPVSMDATDRFAVLQEIIEQAERKVLVFVPYINTLDQVVASVSKYTSVVSVSGRTTDKARKEIFRAFEEDLEPRVLVAHPKVAAHGLTLVAANLTVWFAPIFSSELYLQANERMNRPGQQHNMSIIHLGGSAVEWGAYDVVRSKVGRQEKILDLYRQVLTKTA